MKTRISIRLHADDPIIITASSASSDQGEALLYIPGAALWGALASRIYADCVNSWELFHSGALKISNGYPVLSGAVAWPVPLCLHHMKGKPARLGNAVCAATDLLDGIGQLLDGIGQPEQFRNGFVNDSSDDVQNPQMQDAIKTAINPETGAAAQSQIFASEAITAGQSFVFWLEGPEALVAQAQNGLGKWCYLGRSRSAEFGKSTLSEITLPDWPKGGQITDKTAYVWLMSDLYLNDEHGQPLLRPKDLGPLVKGDIDWKHSFLRFRDFWPYNAKWQSRALARQVIGQGSVFRLENANVPSGFVWIGEDNSTGCGLVYISDQPPLKALKVLPVFSVATDRPSDIQVTSPLADWLAARSTAATSRDMAMNDAAERSTRLLDMLAAARAHPANSGSGPTKTQLNQLRNAIVTRADDWMIRLWGSEVSEVEGNSDAENDPAWGFLVSGENSRQMTPLFRWVKEEIKHCDSGRDNMDALIKTLEIAAKGLDDREGVQ